MSQILAVLGPPEWILLVGAVAVFAIIAQRDYQRYKLQKAAIEKGLSVLPTGAPIWLASLKKGVLVTACGAGLIVMGSIGLATLPDPRTIQLPPQQRQGNPPPPQPTTSGAETGSGQAALQGRPNDGPEGFNSFDPPPRGPGGPSGLRGPGGPGPQGNPQMRQPQFGADGRPLPGPDGKPPLGPDGRPLFGMDGKPQMGPDGEPQFNPRRQAEQGRQMCIWAIGAGGVIALVGLVLTLFALVERKYVTPVSLPDSEMKK